MIDHTGIVVASATRSESFYQAALAPLGYELVVSRPGVAAFGPPDHPLFWLYEGSPAHSGIHIALKASGPAAVDAFHAAALAAGARDNGGPGLRPEYHAHYYGAFVLDPDGNNIEAVCHGPAA